MNIRQAQDAYDLALKEYQNSLIPTPRAFESATGGVVGMGGVREIAPNRYVGNPSSPTNIADFADYNSLYTSAPSASDTAGYKSALEQARRALEEAKANQQGLLGRQYDKLAGQARDALYQGFTGYNPQPLMSASGNSFGVPQGNLSSGGQRIQSLLAGRQY